MERREIIDMATGIAGGLLLVLSIVLFAVVPQDEPVPRTFQVQYVASQETAALDAQADFQERDTVEFPFTIDNAYVHRIAFTVQWTDDVASSDPDTFQFVVNAPDGERVGETVIKQNGPANATSTSNVPGAPPDQYTAQTFVVIIDKAIAAPPRDGPVSGADENEDAAGVRSRLLEDLTTYAPGEWSLEVYLDDAGDCPTPQSAPDRATACGVETQNSNADNGNNLQVLSVSYTTYDIAIQEVI